MVLVEDSLDTSIKGWISEIDLKVSKMSLSDRCPIRRRQVI